MADRELDWDDESENDSGEFTPLPEGDYPFTVTKFERGRHTPKSGGKLPACNKAIITIKVDGAELGAAEFPTNLFLHTSTEGILCAFFTSIGQRKHGEALRMDWGSVSGSTGRARIKHRHHDGKVYHEVDRWLEPTDDDAADEIPF